MSLWKIAWRSMQQRALASTLTGVSMALGVALVIAVLVVYGVVHRSFTQAAQGYDLIVGAKGGKLQLVLNTVYHLSTPIENVPWSYYKEFKTGRFAQYVGVAIPYCLGDSYGDFRVVGTTPEMFTDLEYGTGKKYAFAQGRNFRQKSFFEGVIGSLVARKTGLKVGNTFQPTHGVASEDGHKHDAFKVVGILAPTGTPNDRALFVNMEGFFLLEGHAKGERKAAHQTPPASASDEHAPHEGEAHAEAGTDPGQAEHDEAHHDRDGHDEAHHDHDEHDANDHAHGQHHHHAPLPEDEREVTAILVRTSNLVAGLSLPRAVNKDSFAQAVMPAFEIQNLFEGIVGNLEWILFLLAVLVVLVAGIGIMVSIYNSMSDRRQDIAVMRALGARRTTVMAIILLESLLLSAAGGLAGLLLGHGLIGALSPVIVAQTGVTVGFLQFEPIELGLIPGLTVLAALVGYLPSVAAYRTDVAQALSAHP